MSSIKGTKAVVKIPVPFEGISNIFTLIFSTWSIHVTLFKQNIPNHFTCITDNPANRRRVNPEVLSYCNLDIPCYDIP